MKLKTIANDLVPVYQTESEEKLVDAKELYDKLNISTRFNDWINRQLANYQFAEGEDFYSLLSKTNGRPTKDYFLLLDTAKEIAMVQNNDEGRSVRRYFIEIEKQSRQPMTVEEMIIEQAHSVKEVKQEVQQIKTVVDNEVWVNEQMKKQIQDTVSRRVFELRKQGNEAHFQTIYSSLKRFFGVSKYDKIPRKDFEEAIRFIEGWFPREKKQIQEV